MSQTYKATGINLKAMPLGEADRLLTILTREFGLVRAVAAGSRKHKSSLGGRSGLFVVNELLIAKGRSLDKVTQAETLESYPRLGQDLKKLTASQYLAEVSLFQALSDQPQEELFCLLNAHLKRLENAPSDQVLPHLTQAVFQLLIVAGIVPQVHACCLTRQEISPDWSDPNWRIGFSISAGGVVTLEAWERLQAESPARKKIVSVGQSPTDFSGSRFAAQPHRAAESKASYKATVQSLVTNFLITADELALLQQLAQADLPQPGSQELWLSVERILRQYAQYQFDRPIRSAALIDACFLPIPTCSPDSEP